MSTFNVGRAAFDCGPWGGTIRDSSDRLEFDIEIRPSTFEAAQALRQQIIGHNKQRDIVPVWWNDDSYGYDGFYVVDRCDVSPVDVYLETNRMDVRLSLRRVARRGLLEVRTRTSLRANNDGVVLADTDSNIYLPTSGTEGVGGQDGAVPTATVSTTSGSLDVIERSNVSGLYLTSFYMSPRNFYDGSALIEWAPNTSDPVWYPFSGTQMPDDVTLSGMSFRIGNGRIRKTFETAVPSNARVEVSGGGWDESAADFDFGWGVAGGPYPLTILRNDAVGASIRTIRSTGFYVDYHILRGHPNIEVTAGRINVALPAGTGLAVGMGPDGAGSGSSLSGAIRRSTDDANGRRWALFAPNFATRVATANDPACSTSSLDMGLFYGDNADVTTTARGLYFAAMSQTQRLVSA